MRLSCVLNVTAAPVDTLENVHAENRRARPHSQRGGQNRRRRHTGVRRSARAAHGSSRPSISTASGNRMNTSTVRVCLRSRVATARSRSVRPMLAGATSENAARAPYAGHDRPARNLPERVSSFCKKDATRNFTVSGSRPRRELQETFRRGTMLIDPPGSTTACLT